MTKSGILNPDLCSAIAEIGHTEYFVIADPGLPLPNDVKVIDLTLVRGIPSFLDTLKAVTNELVVESYVLADEMKTVSPQLHDQTCDTLKGLPRRYVPHEELKKLLKDAKAIVRTGETTSFANIILVCGVNF
ncbi:D-ribose pyranase [Clostridium sp. W14A]|uniref:D-ribose pyranase n=1 Tax=Caproicibacter fermentans TaxID=2576756 RepID=A0A7G8T7C9_9FIRM|nr:D-ribose pyranase [Caproicibacter fermentans]OCN01387.1 D-ribose pyranase [Clostridium sp. W14A]QNK39520.1 D-ribose pyranase [Caproicibacter fermentans]